MTWHVDAGSGARAALDDARRETLLEVLWRERPDVVALQGLRGVTLELLAELGEEAELPHVRMFEAPSGAHHGLLSRTPLSAGRSLLETRSAPHGAFAVETRDLTIVSACFAPRSAAEALDEGTALAGVLPRARTLVVGDFAEVRREERTPALDAALPADLAERFPTSAPSAVDVLVHAGFVDAGEGSVLGTSVVQLREEPLVLRLEYALHTPGVEVRELRVIEDDALLDASRHLPLFIDVVC